MMIKNDNLISFIENIEDKVIKTRRELHQIPELSFEEYDTMEYICKRLDELDIKYDSKIAGTGVMGIIKGEKKTENFKTLLIRADIDALPVYEKSNLEFKSKNDGIMHACGHDGHISILLGICEVLQSFKKEFSGCVKLLFQPGEETDGGALPMIYEGVLDNPKVDACLALHVDPFLSSEKIMIKSGPLFASNDDFEIIVKGKGCHGAEPHNGIDPILIGAEIVTSLYTMTAREIDPFDNAVVNIGGFQSGAATNIVPSEAKLMGTVRTFKNELREKMEKRIKEIVNYICLSKGAECEITYNKSYPALINDEKLANSFYEIAQEYIGTENCVLNGKPTMAAEDFAYFSQEAPSFMYRLGSRNEEKGIIYPLHHPSFDIDEKCLKNGVMLSSAFALNFLK